MKIELNKEYTTGAHYRAVVTYQQPPDVQDEFPLIGHVEVEGVKLGMCWTKDGWAGESLAMDITGDWTNAR